MLRLLTPRGTKYYDAVKAYEPYDRLLKPLPDMRPDTIRLVRHANAGNFRAYV